MVDSEMRAFGPGGTHLISMFDYTIDSLTRHHYNIMPTIEYERCFKADPIEGMKIYWREILSRAHLAAATSLLRNRRWIAGVLQALDDDNYFAFSASFRSLLESVADTNYTLNRAVTSLMDYHQQIDMKLCGQDANLIFTNAELESLLIHYALARKQPKGAAVHPSEHAKQNREYIDRLPLDHVSDCYTELCEITHPAWPSVAAFLGRQDDHTWFLDVSRDRELIDAFLTRYNELAPRLIQLALNLSVLAFAVLNTFGVEEVKTPVTDTLDLDPIPAWRTFQRQRTDKVNPNAAKTINFPRRRS